MAIAKAKALQNIVWYHSKRFYVIFIFEIVFKYVFKFLSSSELDIACRGRVEREPLSAAARTLSFLEVVARVVIRAARCGTLG